MNKLICVFFAFLSVNSFAAENVQVVVGLMGPENKAGVIVDGVSHVMANDKALFALTEKHTKDATISLYVKENVPIGRIQDLVMICNKIGFKDIDIKILAPDNSKCGAVKFGDVGIPPKWIQEMK